MEFNIVEVLILVIGVYVLFKLIKLEGHIKRLEYKLQELSNPVDAPDHPIHHELKQLLQEGQDVKAVKRVRETMGLSLLEAKQYVDALKLKED